MYQSIDIHSNKKPTIGILIGKLSDQFSTVMWNGIGETLQNEGVNTITFVPISQTQEYVPRVFEVVHDHLVNDKVLDYVVAHTGLLSTAIGYERTAQWVRSLNETVPVLVVALPVDNLPAVMVDNYSGVVEMVEHLIVDHDRRHFAFVIGGDSVHVEGIERFKAMADTLQNHGVPLDKSLVYRGNMWIEGAEAAIDYFYEERAETKIDAIMCANDATARVVISRLQARGVRVPEDVAVTGFDDVIDSRHVKPALTTVSQSIHAQGAAAAKAALSQIAGQAIEEKIYLPTIFKKRMSCGCSTYALGTDFDLEYDAWVLKMAQAFPQVNENGKHFMAVSSVAGLADAIEKTSREVEFEFCYVFEQGHGTASEQAQLYCGSNQNGVVMPNDFPEMFDCTNILPDSLWAIHPDFHLVVAMLHVDDDVFGYMVMDGNVVEGWMFGSMQVQLSSAMKAVKLLENEKRYAVDLEKQVARRTAELEALLEERASWMRIVAHDLRNPLSVVLMNASLIERQIGQQSAEKLDERIQRIKKTVDRMNMMIGQLLTIDRVEADRIALDRHYVNFADTMVELVNTQSIYAQTKQIDIETDIDPDCWGTFDVGLLSQVCTNLLSNATKYSPSQTTVSVSMRCVDDQLCLIVQDEGLGFSADDKAKMYSPFTQLSARPTGGEGSVGLGLFVVQKLVVAMGGSIQLKSDGRDKGSKFTVLVPAS